MELIKSNPDLTAIDVRMSREEARFLLFVLENVHQINPSMGDRERYKDFFKSYIEQDFNNICSEAFHVEDFSENPED